jgi:hypothetical protein
MAKLIKINRSDVYPDIILDKENGVFEIRGISLPQDARDFYQPVLAFLDEYATNPNKVTIFVFNLKYFNVSSAKMLLFVFYRLKEIYDKGNTVLVTWCFDDDDIKEAGQDFEHMIKIPFQYKEVFELEPA